MDLSFLRTPVIMLRISILMLSITLRAVINNYRGVLTRASADEILRDWANRMMAVVHTQPVLLNPHNVNFRDGRRYVIMCNHSSLYDIPITYATLDASIRMIAKKELFKIPLFASAMRAGEVPKIDRQNREQAIKDLEFAKQKMESGLAIWLAPEGTRSRDGKLQKLKKGGFILAIEAGAWIVPMGIRGANHILPKHTWSFHLGQPIEVHLGEPVDASQYTLDTKDELIAIVEKQLHELTGT